MNSKPITRKLLRRNKYYLAQILYYLARLFPENCRKMKKNGQGGEGLAYPLHTFKFTNDVKTEQNKVPTYEK